MAKASNNKTVVTQRVNVHVIFYSCPDCGHEKEHVEFCSKCGKEMRVIDVVEKFGSEAQELIEKLKESIANRQIETKKEEEPNIIIISEDDNEVVNGADDDADTITPEEVTELEDIFEGTETDAPTSSDDITDISGLLDKEEDEENSFDDLGLDPDDLPTL
ncbi:zinc ribbon domain-containing protein [bacterium]|nr:zinc ribbon domain-containing protein [bacterium]